jgi:mannose-6-phosphate isomerase-like protein (cupin superfamily)
MEKNIANRQEDIFKEMESILFEKGLSIISSDEQRPWGGFFVIDENQAQAFSNNFLNGLNVADLKISGKLSPKLLMVKPNTRLSWQYHHRRAEIWRVIKGKTGVVRSDTDEEGELTILNTFDQITLKQGERHRLVGLGDWAVIAEIWQHTDANNPSNEDDIVRVQDDFGR